MKLYNISNYSTFVIVTTTPLPSTDTDNDNNIFLVCIAMILISMPFCLLCCAQVYLKLNF